MSEAVQVAAITLVVNAAVTWGIVKVQIAWLRRDVDELRELLLPWKRKPRAA